MPEWGDKLIIELQETNPDLLIISGDLTDDGHLYEYEKAKKYIDRLKVKELFMIPGNHDSRNDGYKLFEEFFGERFPQYENNEVIIQGLDSTSPDTDSGHLGRENYHHIDFLKDKQGKIKILVLHHHLIPIPGTGREENVVMDSGDVLGKVVDCGINLVLSGHRHKPWTWKLEHTYFLTTGTATTWRLKGRGYPAFNILETKGDIVTVSEMNIADNTIMHSVDLKLKL
jgi:3',5'-cyclic AMP phosphodiesterase CpdA